MFCIVDIYFFYLIPFQENIITAKALLPGYIKKNQQIEYLETFHKILQWLVIPKWAPRK